MNELSKLLQENLNIEFISATLSKSEEERRCTEGKGKTCTEKRGTLLPV